MSGDSVDNASDMATAAGYFGKMPSRGDFLSFGLSRDFLDPWDDWVRTALEQSRERLSEQWLDIYLTSPLWCFSVGAGICGEQSWAGVLMPSVDAVGRYFPLTVAAPLDPKTNVLSVFTAADSWFEEVEQLARSALEDDLDLDRFDEAIQRLAPPAGAMRPDRADEPSAGDSPLPNAWRYGMVSGEQLERDCPALLHDTLDRLLYSYSLWWTLGSTRVSPSYLLCQGLPPPPGFAAMLDGNWQKWGWDDRQLLMPYQPMNHPNQEDG